MANIDFNTNTHIVDKASLAKIEFQEITFKVEITEQAKDDIRFKFNPSSIDKVTKLKTVAAIYLSLLEQFSKENPDAAREFAMTRTLFQFVSMGGVLAATKGL